MPFSPLTNDGFFQVIDLASCTPIPQSKTREVVSREKQSVSVSIDPADLEDLDPSRSASLTDYEDDDLDAVITDKADDDADVQAADEDPIGGLLRGLFGFAQVGMKLVETAGKTVQRVVENEVSRDPTYNTAYFVR